MMDAILGQDAAKGVLSRAMAGGRMHHAWIFHGPAGVGKRKMAMVIARTLLCHQPRPDETHGRIACGACVSCRLIDADGAHPDLHLIYKELAHYHKDKQIRDRKLATIPTELIRELLLEPVGLSSQMGHGKVFIIDEAELLNPAGQNAMLKTLEEPPDGTFIFLITTREDQLLITIRSRCQRVAFGPLPTDQVEKWIQGNLANWGERAAALSAGQQKRLARLARGSLGGAELAARHGLVEWVEQIEPMLAQIAAGRPGGGLGPKLAELVENYAKQWVADHKDDNASKDAANKAGARLMFSLLGELCREGMRGAITGVGGDASRVEAACEPWLAGVELIQDAERNLEANVGIGLLMDQLAIQWSMQGRA